MAILPTRELSIEFDAGVWTDVFADVSSVTTRRGRNRELGAFTPGTMSFTLRSDTRRYDPDNTAGPYYGKLRPNRRVRFRATYNAVVYPVFVGYIDRLVQVDEGPNAGAVQVDATDLFKLLNRTELAVSAFAAEVAADTPVRWWRLGEPSGATSVIDAVAGSAAAVIGAPTLGVAGLVTRDANAAMTTTTATQGAQTARGATIVAGYPLTLSAVIQSTSSAATGILSLRDTAGDEVATLLTDGTHVVLNARTTVAVNSAVGTVTITDGAPHHVAGVWDAAGVLRVYVDGVANGTTPTLTGTVNPAVSVWIGGGQTYSSGINQGLIGTLDEMAVYASAVSAARIAAWAAARSTPWRGDLPGTRLGRILDLAAVPAADRTLDAGTTTLQSTSLGGSALAYAQKVEETDAGELFVTRDGKMRFLGRDASLTGTYLTSQATFADADSGAGLPYRHPSADVDEATIVTRATVSRDGSVAVTYYDAAAKAEFGWLDETHDGLLHDTDAYSLSYAQWIVNTHKTPITRIGAIDLELPADPVTMYPGVLALEIGDRVTYKRTPQAIGATMTLAMRVEAIGHETGGGYWRTRLQLSPFNRAAGGVPVGVWDSSLWDQAVWGI